MSNENDSGDLKREGLITFLRTETSKEDLRTALKVVLEFYQCESATEWVVGPFRSWMRLEQLVDYLRILTGTEVEEYVTDERAKEYYRTEVESKR